MQLNEIDKFQSMIHGIGSYYGRDVSDAVMNIYWDGLKHHDYQSISLAAQKHMANPENGQFFPKIADFLRYIGGNNKDKALLAWTKLDKAVRQVGPYNSIVFDDNIIHAVISDMGGWLAFGTFTESEFPFKQNEFVKRYNGYADVGVTDYPKQLIGIVEAENTAKGINKSQLVYFGDQDKAKLVHDKGGGKKIEWKHVTSNIKLVKNIENAAIPYP